MTTSRDSLNGPFGRWHVALLGAVAIASITAVAGFHAVLANWSFMFAAVIAGLTAAVIIGSAWSRRLLIGETVAIAAIAMVVIGTIATSGLPTPDAFRSFFDGLINGWSDVLSQTPPLDVTAERRVLPFSLAWIGTIIGGELVRRTGAPVLSTIGPLTALAVSVLVTAEDRTVGVIQGMIIATVALGIGFAQSRNTAERERAAAARTDDTADSDTNVDGESSDSRSRRRLMRAGASLLIIAAVAPFAGPRLPFASANERFDLRDRNEPPWDPLAIPSPLVELKGALRADVRDDVVFTVQSDSTIDRFDLAVLGAYDGVVWTVGSNDAADPRLEFRPVGSRLPPAPVDLTVPIDARSATITVETLDGPWLPSLGWPTAIRFPDDADVGGELRMNLVTGTLAVPSGVEPGFVYELDADLERRPTDVALADLEVRPQLITNDDNVVIPGAIRNIAADVLEGVDRGWEQLQALENKFVTDGFYDTSPESRPGHSYFRLSQFLAEPDRLVGFEEQYVAAAATISELAQLPTRVVVGYLVPPSRYDADGVADVLSSDISAWIEVDFGPSGWIIVDVTPDRSREPVAEAVGKTIEDVAVPSPPPTPEIPPDPEVFSNEEEPEEADDEDEEEEDDESDDGVGAAPMRIIGLVTGGIAGLLALALGLIAGWKILRRRRRRNTPIPAASIGWAWRETLDRYDEAGITLPKTATPQEALRAYLATEPAALAAEGDLRSMVAVVQRSAYHPQPPDTSAGEQAWNYYDGVSQALREQRSVPQRARMLFDPRTLRQRGWSIAGSGRRPDDTNEHDTDTDTDIGTGRPAAPSLDAP